MQFEEVRRALVQSMRNQLITTAGSGNLRTTYNKAYYSGSRLDLSRRAMKLVTVRHRGPFDRYRVHLKRNVSYSTNQQDIGQVTDLDEMRSMLRVLRTGELISRLELFGGEIFPRQQNTSEYVSLYVS
jgi:hypothetical protein